MNRYQNDHPRSPPRFHSTCELFKFYQKKENRKSGSANCHGEGYDLFCHQHRQHDANEECDEHQHSGVVKVSTFIHSAPLLSLYLIPSGYTISYFAVRRYINLLSFVGSTLLTSSVRSSRSGRSEISSAYA